MAKGNAPQNYIRYLPMYGCISTGIIYLGIGVIAILSYMRIKNGGADETSLLAFLNEYIVGVILVWIILLGTISYVLWRIFEAIKDPYKYGNDAKGLARRTGIALSSVADALIAYSALQILFGGRDKNTNGDPAEYREMVDSILDHNAGQFIIVVAGIIVLITAVIQLIYGLSRGYKERIDVSHDTSFKKNAINYLAWIGFLARGIILGITGYFFVKAGIADEAHYVVNTDKAFDFIGDNLGGVAFILVAAGTICYSVFMFLLGASYNADKG